MKCSRWFEFEAGENEKFGESLACPFCPEGLAGGLKYVPSVKTGTYKFNRKLGRLIKVSDSVPGLSGGGGCSGCAGGACSTCGH